MSANIENKAGVYSFVYSLACGAGWHNLGGALPDDAPTSEWRERAGHTHIVEKRPLYYRDSAGNLREYPDRFAATRTDNDRALGIVSDVYKLQGAQPSDIDDICDNFAALVGAKRSAAFTLKNGETICSSYVYGDDVTIGGDRHKIYLMGSTSFDGTSATNFWLSVIRAVCENTIAAGLGDSKAIVKVRHSAKLVASRVQEQMATLAQSVDEYKKFGDKLASTIMTNAEVQAFFRAALDIDPKADWADVSTRKQNQFRDLSQAMLVSKRERGGQKGDGIQDAFTALQAVTRYVDHSRSTRLIIGNDGRPLEDDTSVAAARFDSATFGSGATLKNDAAAWLAAFAQEKVAA